MRFQPADQRGIAFLALLSKGECVDVLTCAEAQSGWKLAGDIALQSRMLPLKLHDPALQGILEHIESACNNVAREIWCLSTLFLDEVSVVRYVRHAEVPLHTDTGPAKPNRVLSIVCYLSEGFEGGELIIPARGYVGREAQGRAIIFSSAERHSVRSLESGQKDVLIGFMSSRPAAWI
jgi:hypothetical protein